MSSKNYKLNLGTGGNIDFIAFLLYLLLVLIGLINIYSVTSDVNQTGFVLSAIATKQLIWIAGAVLIILTVIFANVVNIDYFSYYAYTIAIFLNIAVLFLGRNVKNKNIIILNNILSFKEELKIVYYQYLQTKKVFLDFSNRFSIFFHCLFTFFYLFLIFSFRFF